MTGPGRIEHLHLQLGVGGPVTETGTAVIDVIAGLPVAVVDRWFVRAPHVVALLHAIVTGASPLDHQAIDALGDTRTVTNLRQLLIDGGLLDEQHYKLALFDRWTARFLATIPDTDRTIVTSFVVWGERRRLTRDIATGTFQPWSTRGARQRVRGAAQLLGWLTATGTTLAGCNQRHIDTWIATGPTTRRTSIALLVWAQAQHLCDRELRVAPRRVATPPGLPNRERVVIVRRLIDDDTIRLDHRVAGLLVALYAQPVSRICQLHRDSVSITGDTVTFIVDGHDIEPVAPLDRLLAEQASSSNGFWLFPGSTTGQPASASSISEQLRRLGINCNARVAALHALIEQIPSPVLADLIGYNPNFIAERATNLATNWQHYAALRART